jgi:hypothetical protein
MAVIDMPEIEDRFLAETIGQRFGKDDPDDLHQAAHDKKQAQTDSGGVGPIRFHQQP